MTDQTERLEQLEGRRRLARQEPMEPRPVSTDPLTMAREAVRQAQVVRDRLRRQLDELDEHLTDARHHLDRARGGDATTDGRTRRPSANAPRGNQRRAP